MIEIRISTDTELISILKHLHQPVCYIEDNVDTCYNEYIHHDSAAIVRGSVTNITTLSNNMSEADQRSNLNQSKVVCLSMLEKRIRDITEIYEDFLNLERAVKHLQGLISVKN